MWKRCTCFVSLVAVLALASGGTAYGAFDILKDPALVGWWTCDDGTGTKVADSSPNKRDGTAFQGSLIWGPGVYGGAIELKIPTLVQIPAINITMTQATMAGWVKPIGAQAAWASVMMTRGSATGLNMNPDTGNLQLAYHWGDASTTWGYRPTASLVSNEWHFAAVTVDPAKAVFYFDGVQASVNTVAHAAVTWNAPIFLGGDGSGSFDTRRMTDGWLDDVSLWSRALTADEIQVIMKGLVKPELAAAPSPADGATDVPQDTSFSWTPGTGATAHDVYLGQTFADVNSASVASPKGVLVSPGQTATTYTPAALLDYGQTYSWRIDEVGASTFKGNVWSFTVEPYSYPITNVTATASSSQPSMGPEKTVDSSGMTGDLAGTDTTTMWMSKGVLPNWIQYEFDAVYKLDKLLVWNSNQMIEPFIGFGAKDVTVEYSVDGVTWTTLAGVPQFGQGTGAAGYAANTTVNFAGAMAKYVKLTINKSWGGITATTGLAEVRFTSIPVQARAPQPTAGTAGLSLTPTLNWRPGREATSHTVYLGTDPNAVATGAATASTVTGHTFDTGALAYGTTYYWKVDEIGGAGPYAGNVWSFTTQEFTAIDDFESYNDDDNRIYDTWIDGYTDGLSGSTVGYMNAPFAEKTIVHGGTQSMPMAYDNSVKFFSETNREFATAEDWTLNGATHLGLWFRGNPAPTSVAVTETAGKMTLTGAGTDIWNNSDDFVYAYKTLTGDGTIVARVTSVGTGTNTWAKGGVMIRDSINGGSTFVDTVITGGGGNGAIFQFRPVADAACGTSTDAATVLTAPYWVKIERIGDNIGGYISANGTAWTPLGVPQAITMTAPVLIGICMTSHAAGEDRTFQFDSITTTGGVTGAWQGVQINSPAYNDAAGLYVIVEDSTGKSKVVTHPDPAAAATGTWTRWAIPLSDFTSAGVKTTKVKKLTIGVGDRNNPKAGGSGMLYIDDIGYGTPAATK
ncbi:MAG: discoidin domain-containing protein [Phycisphaerae bacterium]|nr:discoidin domain-containing protein [Phycisphaerae bacterium]